LSFLEIIMSDLRIAYLFPTLQTGNYWHPVFKEFTKIFQATTIYTGFWAGFSPGFEDTFTVQVVGETKFLEVKATDGYGHGIIRVSPRIIGYLHHFKPQAIFTSGFSLWTLFVLLVKPLYRWKVVIICDGSSPNVDYRDSKIRTWIRSWMVSFAEACVTNTQAGKSYLVDILKARESCVFHQPYQVPDAGALLKRSSRSEAIAPQAQRPIFLFVGQVIQRKGLHLLLEACVILKSWGYQNYTLQVIGQGDLREELEAFGQQHSLPVDWIGWVDYGNIGIYFESADVFVLPTLEDTWGMVVLESMVFDKPVLCSKWAGASEMVIHGENGLLFDPHQPEAIARAMRELIDHPQKIVAMGQKSQELIANYTPTTAAQFLAKVTDTVTQGA
jgi:glycosyltransferase involved in cell wall biosynthesis